MKGEEAIRAERLESATHATKGLKFRSHDLGWKFRASRRANKGLVLGVWLDGPLAGSEARVPLVTLARII